MEKSEKTNAIFSWKAILTGSAAGILSFFIFLFAAAFLISAEKIPANSEFITSVVCISAAFLTASIVSAKKANCKKFLSAALSCAIMLILMFLCGTAFKSTSFSVQMLAASLISAALSSLSGSFVCALF